LWPILNPRNSWSSKILSWLQNKSSQSSKGKDSPKFPPPNSAISEPLTISSKPLSTKLFFQCDLDKNSANSTSKSTEVVFFYMDHQDAVKPCSPKVSPMKPMWTLLPSKDLNCWPNTSEKVKKQSEKCLKGQEAQRLRWYFSINLMRLRPKDKIQEIK
jgi:hypothetical protein